jgi:Xaa-Pro aminopeptidase
MTASTWGRVSWAPEARRPWRDLPFPDEEYQHRISALQAVLEKKGYAGIVIRVQGTSFADAAYLSGFMNPIMGDVYIVVPTRGAPALVTDSIVHGEPMHTEIYQVWFDDVRCTISARGEIFGKMETSATDHVANIIRERGGADESWAVSGQVPPEFQRSLQSAIPGVKFTPEELIMPTLRCIKSRRELQLLKEAASIADLAMEAALTEVRPGANERTVAAAIAQSMLANGADGPLYFIQVATGPRAGLRNVRAIDRAMSAGEAVYIGFGLRYQGYCARVANGFSLGAPTGRMEHLMRVNARVVAESTKLIRPGVTTADVATAGARGAEEAGIADITWVGGHGIGVHTHDAPLIGPSTTTVFESGMVVVFEPMVIELGLMTANAERVFKVTDDGCESLSSLPLNLWERLA